MSALGEEFRSAREARGLTLSDVAEAIHIRSVYLTAIENDDWPAIGAPVYVRGFLRTYARFLGLNAEEAVARFNDTAPAERPAAAPAVSDDRERSGPSVWAIAATIVALVLVAFVGWEWWQYAHAPADVTAGEATPAPQPRPAASGSGTSAAAAAAPSAMPSATVAPAARHQLAIRLAQRSWLRVTVDGTTRLEGIFPAGTVRTFSGNVADVRAGNAAGVAVGVDGRPPAAMGGVGDVVEHRYTL
jgi:cytoskeletal protein RodZ